MGNCISEEKTVCINCSSNPKGLDLEHKLCLCCSESENKIKMLNQMIQELHDLIEIKNTGINMLEQQIYLLEKYPKTKT